MFPEINIPVENPAPTEAVATEIKTPADPLAEFLGGYKDVTLQDNSQQPVTPQSGAVNTSPVNNQQVEYYKTGKKAGQPRPNKKAPVTVNRATEQTTLSGEILTGALFITLVDLVMPLIIAGLNNRFSKNKIKASDLSLTQKQKNELAPIADRVVKQFDFNGNPNILLIFSMLGIYGANYAMLKFNSKPDEKSFQNSAQK